MADSQEKTLMQKIWEELPKKYPAGTDERTLPDAIIALFKEFATDYKPEWERLNDNARMYKGDHWDSGTTGTNGMNTSEKAPLPSTPIITSTIENIKADLSDEFPEAVIVPDADESENEVLAKVLTKVIAEELDLCAWELEYDKLVQDVLCDGWGVIEIGHDSTANAGLGGSYMRQICNKNFMCDAQTPNMQNGRAVFKVDRLPKDWIAQRYPKHAPFLQDDTDLVEVTHDAFDATTEPNERKFLRVIEAWFRVYDEKAKKFKVHFVLVAGGIVLENSCSGGEEEGSARPDGVYDHGMYPFVIARLFHDKGSALGFGITDLFKDANRYADKLDQILLTNAYRSSKLRLFLQDDMVDDVEQVKDFSNEVITVKGAPQSVAAWQTTPTLPSHMITYMQMIREMIKQESGANDQSRGQTGGGVTAGSAITALQEMSTKRSRMEARAIHYAFKEGVRMMISVLREFEIVPRTVSVTIGGQKQVLPFDKRSLVGFTAKGKGKILPIENYISIKTARQTKYSKLQQNEFVLQIMQALQGRADVAVLMEAMDFDRKDEVLDIIRRAQSTGMAALQQQNEQMKLEIEAQQLQLQKQRKALSQADALALQNMSGSTAADERNGAITLPPDAFSDAE